ncbi:site-specific DNA-methyltransferase [Candidatus Vampirococcus lugosii]|uniref:Type III restriction-modification system methylation subunit n=1 Tax=Candidatus Vampirococcus lugosii TaxID=2789015 RepID=A0ABS5QL54_9BACT|nr:DNA methyltransferase [Candidatus Vampirococcus lugosii]MBS8121878.1 Type III restriction-modification system methylation subunit [Candidatus Vampirococcus lugosii]
MTNSLSQLKTSLKEMFQFQNNDLNFGIFKIYKLKQSEIKKFIDDNLENIVQKELQKVSNLEEKFDILELELFLKGFNQEKLLENINENYEKIKGTINIFGNGDKEKLIKILKSQRNSFIEGDLENKIYNYILNFFELYYSDGDFGYNTRSLNTYKIEYDEDYNGSDIMFHWKHKGSYYIKTGNGFNSINFELQDKNIEFTLETNEESDAEEQSQNNNRETEFKHYKFNRIEKTGNNNFKVIFNLSKTSTPKEEIYRAIFKGILNIEIDDNFLYNKEGKEIFKSLDKNFGKIENGNLKGFSQLKIKKDDLVKKYDSNFGKGEKINKFFDELDDNIKEEKIIKILWNLDNKLNSFYIGSDSDFFIHKDLKDFLTNEKDKFIKNNILGDINTILNSKIDNTTLVIAKTFNEISSKIIEFLSAIEEFQKGIFESKKKVLVNEYCITLDKIDESFYTEILENKEQIQEWKNLGFIEDEKVLNIEYLKANLTLNIDTKFFSQTFKDNLLSNFEDLENQTNGILINSENYQALSLLKNKYRGKVKCIYIDPPYNTGKNFVYKNSFRHSSWISMMENRLLEAKQLLTNDGIIIIAIDDLESDNLRLLCDSIFLKENFIGIITTICNPQGRVANKTSKTCEYNLIYAKDILNIGELMVPKNGITSNVNLKRTGTNSRRDERPNRFYPILIKNNKITMISMDEYNKIYSKEDKTFNDDFLIDLEKKYSDLGYSFILPKTLNGEYLVWQRTFDRVLLEKDEYIVKGDSVFTPAYDDEKPKTCWTDAKYSNPEYGSELLKNILGEVKFETPKSVFTVKDFIITCSYKNSIILDFFSGSGTTQHAVIELNKEDGGNRKYIGVEIGEYFDSVTKSRIQKVMYTSNWKDGIPQDNKGVSQIMKYQVLEQYEDMLDKLEIDNEKFPEGLDLKYLYKKEEIKLKSTLNLRKPFFKYLYLWKS